MISLGSFDKSIFGSQIYKSESFASENINEKVLLTFQWYLKRSLIIVSPKGNS